MGWNGTHAQTSGVIARECLPARACKSCVYRLRQAELDLRSFGDFECTRCGIKYEHKQ